MTGWRRRDDAAVTPPGRHCGGCVAAPRSDRPVADYPALADAVESVASLLREHVTNSGEPVIAGIQIDLRSPRELELATTTAKGPCLSFESGALKLALPLADVSQVASKGPMFNAAPGVGSFVGVLMHQQRLVPAFSLTGTEAEALLVVIELQSGPVALSASRAHGVKSPEALGDAQVIDAVATFG